MEGFGKIFISMLRKVESDNTSKQFLNLLWHKLSPFCLSFESLFLVKNEQTASEAELKPVCTWVGNHVSITGFVT